MTLEELVALLEHPLSEINDIYCASHRPDGTGAIFVSCRFTDYAQVIVTSTTDVTRLFNELHMLVGTTKKILS